MRVERAIPSDSLSSPGMCCWRPSKGFFSQHARRVFVCSRTHEAVKAREGGEGVPRVPKDILVLRVQGMAEVV